MAEQAKHWPGPWESLGISGSGFNAGIDIEPHTDSSCGPVIARVYVTNLNEHARQRTEATARLIAAAPDLFNLVRRWRDEVLGGDHPESLDGWAREFVQEAGELIRKVETTAKAEGK